MHSFENIVKLIASSKVQYLKNYVPDRIETYLDRGGEPESNACFHE